MANPLSSTTAAHPWTDTETEAVLEHFFAERSQIGEAGNFKKKTYMSAAESIPGKTRTWEQVKNKWQAVSQASVALLS